MDGPEILTAADEHAAAEELYRRGCTDGLPIVVPIPERVEKMLEFSGGLDPNLVLGDLAPAYGQLTVRSVAVNAVMAGCFPEMFPLVLAAAEAIADPLFDIGPMQATTHCVTPFIFVNGPARAVCDVQSGVGALGPGFRTNATLGRAVRLLMINVGGGRPGIGDMASLGSPAKFSCCLAEAEEQSPFEPFHVSQGFSREDSTVTVLGIEAPHSFYFAYGKGPERADLLLRTLGAALANPGSNSVYHGIGMPAILLNPIHANKLAECGWSRREIQQRLFEYAAMSRKDLRALAGAGADIAPHRHDLMRVVQRPEDFVILVTGDNGGAYSLFMPSWCGGTRGQVTITKRVRMDDICEVPPSLRENAAPN